MQALIRSMKGLFGKLNGNLLLLQSKRYKSRGSGNAYKNKSQA